MRNRSGRRGSPTRARAGRPLGATSWSRNLANIAAHHAKVLLELWLAEVPVLVQVLFRQLPHSPEPAFKHVREMARSYTEEAVLTIVNIMRNKSNDGWLRLACANAILDRGFGKPREEQVVEQEDLLTTEYRTVDEIEAALIAKGIPIDRLRAPKLIEHDNDR